MARISISLLPESLAAGVRGSLASIEHAAERVERDGVTASVDAVHPADAADAIGLAGAMRSLRRRARWVRATLLAIVTLVPERFLGVAPTIAALRETLGVESVLVALRHLVEPHLAALPIPFGFRTRVSA